MDKFDWMALTALALSIIAAIFACAAAWFAARNSAASVSVQKLTWLQAELLDTRDMIEGLQHSLGKLRRRRYMRDRREEEPEPTDREAIKAKLRAKVGLVHPTRKE